MHSQKSHIFSLNFNRLDNNSKTQDEFEFFLSVVKGQGQIDFGILILLTYLRPLGVQSV